MFFFLILSLILHPSDKNILFSIISEMGISGLRQTFFRLRIKDTRKVFKYPHYFYFRKNLLERTCTLRQISSFEKDSLLSQSIILVQLNDFESFFKVMKLCR